MKRTAGLAVFRADRTLGPAGTCGRAGGGRARTGPPPTGPRLLQRLRRKISLTRRSTFLVQETEGFRQTLPSGSPSPHAQGIRQHLVPWKCVPSEGPASVIYTRVVMCSLRQHIYSACLHSGFRGYVLQVTVRGQGHGHLSWLHSRGVPSCVHSGSPEKCSDHCFVKKNNKWLRMVKRKGSMAEYMSKCL